MTHCSLKTFFLYNLGSTLQKKTKKFTLEMGDMLDRDLLFLLKKCNMRWVKCEYTICIYTHNNTIQYL
jgi:hypothetical protein